MTSTSIDNLLFASVWIFSPLLLMLFIKSFLFLLYNQVTIFSLLVDSWGVRSHIILLIGLTINVQVNWREGLCRMRVVLIFRFYWVPGIDRYLTYIYLQNPCCGWNILVDRLGNGTSKKLSDLFQGQLGFKCWADP